MRPCDPNSAFFGFMGIAASSIFSNLGAAFGTAKSGVGVCSVGVMRPDLIMKSILPVVMAGVLGIYGIIMSILIYGRMTPAAEYSTFLGYTHLSSGLIVGLSSLAAGLAIGIVGDAGVRANAQQNRLFIGMILILVFSETLALYGLIIGIYISISEPTKLCASYATQ
ncbi:V-type proton ATPase 16 kDa proteolipid subunit [Plasmodium brasilianum]|uniref:V-type proton ATPase proteolipid subunit n=2 Tax=Plasmodium (Plasmodium) TaxID=418103 RepID=A0A1D3RI62_PLAMA|nr:V-type proton ATPase 16 kDa proteolipid subunit, putative [Plasmodium malariae]KAI4837788.1 V-type proton ATPase 16 kDa proteolipid subunit [Plasmodium brasilianum]SCN44803.1 V-type proton ATPase 16 kDa proteolipid subunit, putative [Plasmodium malariae]